MPMEEALRARFLALPALAGAKVSWFERPRRGAMPHMLLTHVAPGENWTHGGVDDLSTPRIQIDVWSEDSVATATAARAIRAELSRSDDVTVGDTTFLPPAAVFSDQWSMDPLAGGDDLFRATIDVEFNVQPAE